jgi:hypothetical protein
MDSVPADNTATHEMLRTVMYVVLATSAPDHVRRYASSFDAVSTWPQLQPATRALLEQLAKDAEAFAAGRPPAP